MPKQEFTITFWGVRGGYPKPGPTTNKFGGNTTCLEIQAGKHQIIIDAGTGIIGLGEKLVAQHQVDKQSIRATMLFTHTHHDHTQGFPFFRPSHLGSSILHIFGPKLLHQNLDDILSNAMLPPLYPVRLDEQGSTCIIRNIAENEMIILNKPDAPPKVCNVYHDNEGCSEWEVRIRVMRSYAHPQGVFIYRIEMGDKKLVVATDVEGYIGGDRQLIKFASGADVLIHDAEYTSNEYLDGDPSRQGWGHSTWEMAIDVAKAAKVKKLILTHHNAHHDDDFLENLEQQVQANFPEASMSREGMTVSIG